MHMVAHICASDAAGHVPVAPASPYPEPVSTPAAPAEPDVAELTARAAVLAVGIEIADLYRADGQPIPDPLLAEIAEYRRVRSYLDKVTKRPARRADRRRTRATLRILTDLTAPATPAAEGWAA